MEYLSPNTQIHEYPLRVALSIFFVCFALFTYPQASLSSSNKKAIKAYHKADKKYKERDFESALSLLTQATKYDPNFYEAYVRKGSLYNALGNEDSVYSNFTKYEALAPSPSASVLERLANMAFDRGQYRVAKEFLEAFLALVPEKKDDKATLLLENSIPFALEQLQNQTELIIQELPETINRFGLQYLPTMTVDQKTLVFTKRDEFRDDEDIVVSYFKEGDWSSAVSISPKINTPYNEGASSISADGRTMIFTACDRREGYGSCDLYISKKSGKTWSRPKNLGKVVNSKYWESQPSLSADGRTLFFASTRPGGFGGKDIWMTTIQSEDWGKPVNLGSSVNSFKDETTPFIHFNGQTLFFSSNSYVGMGGFDLFKSEREDSLWTQPENLGYPINTFRDEVALLMSADGANGYFAKELQKNREILESKIVKFEVPNAVRPTQSFYLAGKVIDSDTKKPLQADLQIVDLVSNEFVYNSSSDAVSGAFYFVLPQGRQLGGYVKKEGYFYENFSFDASLSSLANTDTITVALSPLKTGESLILKNIYFDTNAYALDERSRSEIANVFDLLNRNKAIAIEIGGHTDDVGSKDYNQSLSEKRAEAVYEALIEKGVSPSQMRYKGYGDEKPIKANDTSVNRKSNRRIEFRVIRTK